VVDLSGTRVRRVEKGAFKLCVELSVVRLPAMLEEVGDYGFGWTSVEKVRLSHCRRLVRIGACAFSTLALRKVGLPAGLRVVGAEAFACLRLGGYWPRLRYGGGTAVVDAGSLFDWRVFVGARLRRITLRGGSLLSSGSSGDLGRTMQADAVVFSVMVGLSGMQGRPLVPPS
jgi:hypothetical protein